MKKELDMKRKAHLYPTPVVVVGTKGSDGKIDWSTVAYTGIADSNHISLSVSPSHKTAINMRETGKCSINIPSAKDAPSVDKAGTISGITSDKSSLFPVFYGNDKDIPMVSDFPLTIECTVERIYDADGHDFFYCRCDHVWLEERKKPEVSSIEPLLFAWEAYLTAKNNVGKPWGMN